MAWSLEGKELKWDGDNNVKHMLEEVKWAMVENAREVCGSVRVAGKNPKSVRWNDKIKAAVRRKEAAWKEVLAASNEETRERCIEAYREEKRKVERCIIQSKKKVNKQFGRKMNENVNGNRKLFFEGSE